MSSPSKFSFRPLGQILEAIGVYLAWGLFALLPLDWASGFGGWAARWLGPRLKVSQRARHGLAKTFPEKDKAEIEAIVIQVWDNLGRTVAEFPHLKRIAAERIEVIGVENLESLRDDGKPGFIVSAHFCGWELSSVLCHQLGLPVHVVYRAANNHWVENLFRTGRGLKDELFIPKGGAGSRRLIEVMKSAGHVAIMIDQKMNDGISVPFLGREAMTAPAVARLALKYACPVVAGHIERLNGAHFRAILEPPITFADSGDVQKDVLDAMVQLNDIVGGWIRQRPGQWLWLHRRWAD